MRNEPVTSAKAEAVFVGYGIVAPEYDWNDYEGIDVKNKIVVTLVNDPGLRDTTIFRGPILTYYGRWTYKIEEARRQGAAGILMIHTTESATYPWTTVQSGWTGPQVRIEEPPTSLLGCGVAEPGSSRPLVPSGRTGPRAAHGESSHSPVPGCAAGSSAGRKRPKRDHPVRDQQRAGPVARAGTACKRGGAHYRPLRSLRDRDAGRR